MANKSFSGSYSHALDSKGRAIIPAPYREALGEDFTITVNPTRTAVAFYPKDEWEKQLERLSHIDPLDPQGVAYERYIMSLSFSGNNMDGQGRVLLPTKLRTKMGLTKDVVFIGLNNFIEIWDKDLAKQQENIVEEGFDGLLSHVLKTYPT